MNDIANLQEAVETARAAYARASEQHARSRKHAMSLIHIVEEQLREKRIELSQNEIQHERATRDYGQLRQMHHALVMAVEVGAPDRPANGAAQSETKPETAAPPAPLTVVAGSQAVRANEAATADAKPQRRQRAKTKVANGGADAGPDEVRAGLKRMLKKKRTPSGEAEQAGAGVPEAPAPAK